jgi:hypothetical protein
MVSQVERTREDHMDIQRSLGRIEGKLDSLVYTLAAHTAEDTSNFMTIEKQMDQLQRLVWMGMGVIAFLGVSIPVAIAYISSKSLPL